MSPLALGLLASLSLALASLPACLTLANLLVFRRAPQPPGTAVPTLSVLVPARDEAAGIQRMATAVLASRGVDLELVVLDDGSRDATASIIEELSKSDTRVRLVRGRPLEAGWCGKQYACAQLAEAARHDLFVFLDADVSLEPDALARSVAFLDQSGRSLASGFPLQLTGSFLEWLLLPLIHFLLLGYLPLGISRSDNSPALAAGCGQLFLTYRHAYLKAGGHAAIRSSLHDGIKLPRAYRRVGLTTDVFDASDIARCRMYTRSFDVLQGLSKNATEGVGSPRTIVPFTVLLAGGQVLPVVLVAVGMATAWHHWPTWAIPMACVAVACVFLPRLLEAARFNQSVLSSLMHPLGILLFLGIQWFAFACRLLGFHTSWRGRSLVPQ